MGTTLWVLSKNEMADGDDWDHSAMFRALEKLDFICEDLGLGSLSSFVDWTDFELNMSEEEDEFLAEETLRTETSWFDPTEALPILKALYEHLANDKLECENLFEPDQKYLSEDLIEELSDCITKVEQIANQGDLFHFCAVM
jgi:hypothetical protein